MEWNGDRWPFAFFPVERELSWNENWNLLVHGDVYVHIHVQVLCLCLRCLFCPAVPCVLGLLIWAARFLGRLHLDVNHSSVLWTSVSFRPR
jgi:hypothetical protein